MIKIPCPYLKGEVELSEEREQHIAQHHPDLLPLNKRLLLKHSQQLTRFAVAPGWEMPDFFRDGFQH